MAILRNNCLCSILQLKNLSEPRAVAVDWVAGWVYVGCSDAVVAVAVKGSAVVTVIKATNLKVNSLVLDPESG